MSELLQHLLEKVCNQNALNSTSQTWFKVDQLSAAEPEFSIAAVRKIVFEASPRETWKGLVPGNGLIECGAIVRIGRKVLIHRERFIAWVEQRQNQQTNNRNDGGLKGECHE